MHNMFYSVLHRRIMRVAVCCGEGSACRCIICFTVCCIDESCVLQYVAVKEARVDASYVLQCVASTNHVCCSMLR